MKSIDKSFLEELLIQAQKNPRLRQNYDLRTSVDDHSQRMLNALLPGTCVPIHRHPQSTEDVLLLSGRAEEILYEEVEGPMPEIHSAVFGENGRKFREVDRCLMDPKAGQYGCVVPVGAWHTITVLEPSVIFEAKDGSFGKDGSEIG